MRAGAKLLLSAGRGLPVTDGGRFDRWWPDLHVHILGATSTAPRPLPGGEEGVDITGCDTPSAARRVVNAHLHVLHLAHDTVSAHAVALATPAGEGAVVLLGGHGAGKTLVATALTTAGWVPVAGDVTLVRVEGGTATVVGGTSAFEVRAEPTARWFPHLSRHGRAATGPHHLCEPPAPPISLPVLDAAWVRVDGDPQLAGAQNRPMDPHTAHTLWWAASAHLVDRLAPTGHNPLRLLETPAATGHRAALVRSLTDHLTTTVLWGDPRSIAEAVVHRIQEGGPA